MVTPEQIQEWKAAHGYVYRAKIDGKDYYFRTLNRQDYMIITAKQLQAAEGVFDHEMETVKVCLLNEDVTDEELSSKSGLVTILTEQIMLKSGFQQVESEEL